jgi:hypothetical protein
LNIKAELGKSQQSTGGDAHDAELWWKGYLLALVVYQFIWYSSRYSRFWTSCQVLSAAAVLDRNSLFGVTRTAAEKSLNGRRATMRAPTTATGADEVAVSRCFLEFKPGLQQHGFLPSSTVLISPLEKRLTTVVVSV